MANPDYIIVGGGTAGLVVANRLTEDPSVQVLVVEAGTDMTSDPRVVIPGLWTTLQGSEADWQYQSVHQPAMNDRQIREPQGKLLGGSSGINGQAFIAPGKGGVDAWAKLGNAGWDFDTLGPYYKKAYTLVLPEDQETREHLGIDWIDSRYQGDSGPLKVGFPGVKENPLIKAWLDAFRDEGKLTNADPYSGESIGGYSNLASVDPETKTRSYAASAYGLPAMQRPNLKVVLSSTVHKIVFEESQDASPLKAIGVLVTTDGKTETLTAKKEVILAAGVFGTPKLLELSGIGNPEILSMHNINTIIDLPGVGENLQDHLMTGISYEVADGVITGDPLMRQEPEALKMAQDLYVAHKAGPLTFGGVQSNAFMATENASAILDKYPPPSKPEEQELYNIIRDIYQEPNPGASAVWFMFLAQANLHEGAKSFVGTKLLPGNFASFGCSQSQPFSRGSSHISSSSTDASPIIDPGYFTHPADLEIMARHVQSFNKFREAKAFAPFFKVDGQRNHPDAFKVGDLEEAKKYVLDTATTTFHCCGTAAMLPREKKGVVDPKLFVHGTKNLRVVDSSIIPLIPRGNIQSTVYAVAERAADIIKGI